MSDYQCPSCGGICKKSGCERTDVPAKTLTDEEIDQVVDEVWKANPWSDVEGLDINAFARAILRKAQE